MKKREAKESNGGGNVAEIRAAMPLMASAAGVTMPGNGRALPMVPLDQPLSGLCRAVGQALAAAPLFRMGEEFVTVDPETGETRAMTSDRFISWHQGFFHFYAPPRGENDPPRILSITRAGQARQILASDELRAHVRPLRAVHSVRLPVWRGSGPERTVDLLPAGYDLATGIFTADALHFAKDWTLDQAAVWLMVLLEEFPWYESGPVIHRRSLAAQVASMVGTFCKGMFPPGTVRPMVVYNGNQSGTGKSKLMRIGLAPVHGAPAENSKPKSEEELRNVLDAVALVGLPYLVLDDVVMLASPELNKFVTSPRHSPRIKGKSVVVPCDNVTQVFVTGNGLVLTEDLLRRSLVVDLHERRKASARTFARVIADEWISSDAFRRDALSALWALVRHWKEQGCPVPPEALASSFEAFKATVGGIVASAGFAHPFAPRECSMGGDESSRALERTLARLASALPADGAADWTGEEILEVLRADGVLDVVLPFAKDERKSLGHRLAKLRGREFLDDRGRAFEFGRRDTASRAVYPVRILPGAGEE